MNAWPAHTWSVVENVARLNLIRHFVDDGETPIHDPCKLPAYVVTNVSFNIAINAFSVEGQAVLDLTLVTAVSHAWRRSIKSQGTDHPYQAVKHVS